MKMFKRTKYNWKRAKANLTVDMDINIGRLEGNFQQAQRELDSAVMTGMIPYMPMVTGAFIDLTKTRSDAIAGTGVVYAAAPPYGRFLYEGKTMVSEESGSTWAKYGERKVLVSEYQGKTNASENLNYTTQHHSDVQSHWFDAAKQRYGKSWTKLAKKTAGGG